MSWTRANVGRHAAPLPQVWAMALMKEGQEKADNCRRHNRSTSSGFPGASGRPRRLEKNIAAFQTSFPSYEEISSERPAAVKGGPTGAGGATPLTASGRSEMVRGQGKEGIVRPIRSRKRFLAKVATSAVNHGPI